MNRDVFLAILAMDAYNRGPDDTAPGVKLSDNPVGYRGGIGTASFNSEKIDSEAGFYALAYDWNGEQIISFRGTARRMG